MTSFASPQTAGLGWQEVLVILVVALLLFGGKKLPEIARSLGRATRTFRREMNGLRREWYDVQDTVGRDDVLDDGPAASGDDPPPTRGEDQG